MRRVHSDFLVIGSGIVGLAHAWAAASRGMSVTVLEKNDRCTGASIRNFGFVTVTGQRAGTTWQRARRSREIWSEVAPAAKIPVCQTGLWVLGRRPEAGQVLEAFAASAMGEGCRLYAAGELSERAPYLRSENAWGGLYSPHELRVESTTAIPLLAMWLRDQLGVRFFFGHEALELDGGRVNSAKASFEAERVVICPGTELAGLAAPYLAGHGLSLTQLQMMRLSPVVRTRLPSAVMSDLSLVRYAGYTGLGAHQPLLDRLQAEQPEALAAGIHLIVVQGLDGSLVVGDSHHPAQDVLPFIDSGINSIILQEMEQTMCLGGYVPTSQWLGWYPVGGTDDALVLAPHPSLRVVTITSGTGASTAFGLAEEVIETWIGNA
jgi:FAD dependent oxidoreductase TIGR03364